MSFMLFCLLFIVGFHLAYSFDVVTFCRSFWLFVCGCFLTDIHGAGIQP